RHAAAVLLLALAGDAREVAAEDVLGRHEVLVAHLAEVEHGEMFECTRFEAMFASSMNWFTTLASPTSSGRRRLMTNFRRKPSAPKLTAVNTWAMPPSPRR